MTKPIAKPKTVGKEIVPHPDLDFSHYRPGDVVAIDISTIEDLGQAQSTLLIMHIANAATRAGLKWEVQRCEHDRMIRVHFSEYEAA